MSANCAQVTVKSAPEVCAAKLRDNSREDATGPIDQLTEPDEDFDSKIKVQILMQNVELG